MLQNDIKLPFNKEILKNIQNNHFKSRIMINKIATYSLVFLMTLLSVGCTNATEVKNDNEKTIVIKEGLKKAYFAAGCFWCVEAVFESVRGVEEVISGYSGGKIKNPTYGQVSSGKYQHAESVEVYYDPEIISYKTLLQVFFGSQNPTTVNQQGNDRGPQYRSIVFYQTQEEKLAAENYIAALDESGVFNSKIVTEVKAFEVFYQAEDYHQNYEKLHPNNGYVKNVSIPRLRKFQAKFPQLLKLN